MQIIAKREHSWLNYIRKTGFKTKSIRENHYIMIKGSIHKEEITIVNIYAPNIRAPKKIIKHNKRAEGRNRQQYDNCRGLQYSTFNNR